MFARPVESDAGARSTAARHMRGGQHGRQAEVRPGGSGYREGRPHTAAVARSETRAAGWIEERRQRRTQMHPAQNLH